MSGGQVLIKMREGADLYSHYTKLLQSARVGGYYAVNVPARTLEVLI